VVIYVSMYYANIVNGHKKITIMMMMNDTLQLHNKIRVLFK